MKTQGLSSTVLPLKLLSNMIVLLLTYTAIFPLNAAMLAVTWMLVERLLSRNKHCNHHSRP